MKHFLSVVVLLLILALGGLFHHSQQQLAAANAERQALQQEIRDLRAQVDILNGKVVQLDESSVQGIVREANSAILDGWESLVNSVENELKEARRAFEAQNPDETESAPDARLESPDGTERI